MTVEGWFLRGTSPWMGLRRLTTSDDTIRGFIHLGSLVGAGILVAIGVLVFLFLPEFL